MLQKGSQVFVEANFELREPDPDADPDSPQGQRQIFLRHGILCFHVLIRVLPLSSYLAESIRVLKSPLKRDRTESSETSE